MAIIRSPLGAKLTVFTIDGDFYIDESAIPVMEEDVPMISETAMGDSVSFRDALRMADELGRKDINLKIFFNVATSQWLLEWWEGNDLAVVLDPSLCMAIKKAWDRVFANG